MTTEARPVASQERALQRRAQDHRRALTIYAIRRVAMVPPGVFVIATLSFLLAHVTPSDPARAILGAVAPRAAIEQLNRKLGLAAPLWHQYVSYLGELAHGTLGHSYYGGASIWHDITSRLASSLELIVISLAFAIILGVSVGTLGAYYRGRIGERAAVGFIGLGQAIPDFVIGIVATYVLFFELGVLPAPEGQLSFATTPPPRVTGAAFIDSVLAGQWGTAGAAVAHLVLPVLALTLPASVFFARITKSTLGESLDAAHTYFARSCGVRERTVVWQALRTIVAPLLTYLAVIVAGSIGGVAIVETLFSWDGLGQWAAQSMINLDLPAVQGIVLLSGTLTFLVFIASDIGVKILDPRVAAGERT